MHGVALALRRGLARRGFAVDLAGLRRWSAAAASLSIWLLVMLLDFRLLSPRPAIFMAVLTVAIYPALAVPFAARASLDRQPGGRLTMRRDAERTGVFTRRALLLMGGQVAVLGALGGAAVPGAGARTARATPRWPTRTASAPG